MKLIQDIFKNYLKLWVVAFSLFTIIQSPVVSVCLLVGAVALTLFIRKIS